MVQEIATGLTPLAMTVGDGAGPSFLDGSQPTWSAGAVPPALRYKKSPTLRWGISYQICSSQYAERILATGRAVLLDCRQAQSTRHEFGSRHCRATGRAVSARLTARKTYQARNWLSALPTLQLGASGDQSLALVVAGVLLEVLDEAGGQILGLLLPDGSVGVGVAGWRWCTWHS